MTIDEAIQKLNKEIPGWWWRIGDCSISADATIAPDASGPDADLLVHKVFDEGFDGDLSHPATVSEALINAIEIAKQERAKFKPGPPVKLVPYPHAEIERLKREKAALVAVVKDMLSGLAYLRLHNSVPYGFGVDRLENSGKAALGSDHGASNTEQG